MKLYANGSDRRHDQDSLTLQIHVRVPLGLVSQSLLKSWVQELSIGIMTLLYNYYRHVIISLESSWTALYNPDGKNRVPLILDNGRPWLSGEGCLQPGARSWILSYVREIWSKKIIIKICDIVIYSMFRTGLLVLTRPYPNNIPRLLQEVTRHVKETLYVHLAPGIPEQLNAHSRKVTLVISFLHFNLAQLFTLHGGLICITFCLSVGLYVWVCGTYIVHHINGT